MESARTAAKGRGEGLHCTCTAASGGRGRGREGGGGATQERSGKVYVLSGELDGGDRIIPCCKASYRTEEKLLLCLSLAHEGERGEKS